VADRIVPAAAGGTNPGFNDPKKKPTGREPGGLFCCSGRDPEPSKRLVRGAEVLNDPFFPGGLSMGNPKIAIVAYCLAVGFILVVALHSPSKTLITASAPVGTPVVQ
jgi:hypothetical protein